MRDQSSVVVKRQTLISDGNDDLQRCPWRLSWVILLGGSRRLLLVPMFGLESRMIAPRGSEFWPEQKLSVSISNGQKADDDNRHACADAGSATAPDPRSDSPLEPP